MEAPGERRSGRRHPPPVAIVSHPQSGNHLARFIIEFLTGRPTRGCLGHDPGPVADNRYPLDPDVLAHVGPEAPVAQKAHWWDELAGYRVEGEVGDEALLLLIRNPYEVVPAHLRTRLGGYGAVNHGEPRQTVGVVTSDWQNLIVDALTDAVVPMEVVWYEDLVSTEERAFTEAVATICAVFGDRVDSSRRERLLEHADELRDVCAGARGRAWSGVRSRGEESGFHLKLLPAALGESVPDEVGASLLLLCSLTAEDGAAPHEEINTRLHSYGSGFDG